MLCLQDGHWSWTCQQTSEVTAFCGDVADLNLRIRPSGEEWPSFTQVKWLCKNTCPETLCIIFPFLDMVFQSLKERATSPGKLILHSSWEDLIQYGDSKVVGLGCCWDEESRWCYQSNGTYCTFLALYLAALKLQHTGDKKIHPFTHINSIHH